MTLQAGNDPDVASTVEAATDARRLHAALGTLPPAQRHAVELAFFAGLTHGEIALRRPGCRWAPSRAASGSVCAGCAITSRTWSRPVLFALPIAGRPDRARSGRSRQRLRPRSDPGSATAPYDRT